MGKVASCCACAHVHPTSHTPIKIQCLRLMPIRSLVRMATKVGYSSEKVGILSAFIQGKIVNLPC